MSREVDFSQLEQFFQNFNNAYNDFEDFLKKFLLEMALRAIAKIKQRTPVDTGALRAMWGIGSQNLVIRTNTGTGMVEIDPERAQVASIDVVGDSFEVMIWNGMDYASFIEFGARNVDGSWREGFFMMTVSVDEAQRQIPSRFDKAFLQYMKSKGAN